MGIAVRSQPVDSQLRLRAHTTNALVVVRVPAAFEGDFKVKTTNSKASVIQQRVSDPSGRDRGLAWYEDGSPSYRTGAIHWVERHIGAIPATQPQGEIYVDTTNEAATLYI